MKLIIPILLNCTLVLAVYLADKHTPAKKLSQSAKQVIIGVLFGIVSAFASSFGVEWLGTVVNVRDAAPLSAGRPRQSMRSWQKQKTLSPTSQRLLPQE